MPVDTLNKKLIEFWTNTLRCRFCNLPKGYRPQFRPVGKLYRPGGVVFLQINPGYIGGTTKSEIRTKYKSERNRDLSLRKLEMTKYLQDVQEEFLEYPSTRTWDFLCTEYFGVMREIWGWPPGRYARTIEAHGVELDSIAIVNLAQCPVRDNDYNKEFLKKCWKKRTFELLSILRPAIIVAQSKTVFDYCKDLKASLSMNGEPTVLQGVHHASRASSEEKQRLFNKTRIQLKNA